MNQSAYSRIAAVLDSDICQALSNLETVQEHIASDRILSICAQALRDAALQAASTPEGSGPLLPVQARTGFALAAGLNAAAQIVDFTRVHRPL